MTVPEAPSVRIGSGWLPSLKEALARGERFRWSLRGNSMHPTLPTSCRIDLAPVPSRLRLGDLIVFAYKDELVAHRIVHRSKGKWITQGDGRLGPDQPLDVSQILALVIAAYDDHGRLCWPRAFERARAYGWVARYHALRAPRRLRRRLRDLLEATTGR
jgi:hypothetical protein